MEQFHQIPRWRRPESTSARRRPGRSHSPTSPPCHPPPDGWLPGYLDAVEWSWLSGHLDEPGPAQEWGLLRTRSSTARSPQHDGASCPSRIRPTGPGRASRLDKWLFLHTDLTMHLHRAPTGEWIGLDGAVIGAGSQVTKDVPAGAVAFGSPARVVRYMTG